MMLRSAFLIFLMAIPVFTLPIDFYLAIDFHWPKDAESLLILATEQNVQFADAEIKDLSPSILNQLTALNALIVSDGNVTKIYVKPTLNQFYVSNSKTEEIYFDPKSDYHTQKFEVSDCLVKSVPADINRLKMVEELSLAKNKIETLDMQIFDGLNKLTKLNLNGNNIKVVGSSNPVNLPKLESLHLESNQLSQLDICRWNMASLQEFHLNDNRLAYVVNVLFQFRGLKRIALQGNAFNCNWQGELLRDLTKTKIMLDKKVSKCNVSDAVALREKC